MLASILVVLSVLAVFGDDAAEGAPRTAEFSPDCKPYPGKRVVLLTVDSEFMNFFQNWLIHAKPYLTKTEQIVVVPEDEKAVPLLKQEQNTSGLSFDILPVKGKRGPASLLQRNRLTPNFGSQEYGALVTERPAHIANFIGRGCTVFYVDIDSAWAKDPFEEIALAGKHDLYLTDDTPGNRMAGVLAGTSNNWYACTCLLYLQPTKAVRGLVRKWSGEVESAWRNQPALNKVLREDHESKKTVDFALLPFGKFPPGKVGSQYKGAAIYHANYHKGVSDKIDYMKEMGVWKL
jgi:hypothetical protein